MSLVLGTTSVGLFRLASGPSQPLAASRDFRLMHVHYNALFLGFILAVRIFCGSEHNFELL